MLEAKGLESVRGGRRLFGDLSFSLSEGELLEISGANGSGKTTLLRILCGLLSPTAGDILWQSQSLASRKEEYLSSLAYIAHANGVKGELSATENLRIHGGLSGVGHEDTKIDAALQRMGLLEWEFTPARFLSQGQQRRLALSRLLIGERKLWILDEPLTALDSDAVSLVQSILEEHLNAGGMAVLTTHQALDIRANKSSRIRLASSSEH